VHVTGEVFGSLLLIALDDVVSEGRLHQAADATHLEAEGGLLEGREDQLEAQGGDPNVTSDDVEIGKFSEEILSRFEGYVTHVHNKKIFTLARAAGSPKDKGAGLILNKKRGDKVDKGEMLFTLYADNQAKLNRAKSLANKINALTIEGMVLEHIPGRSGIVDFSNKDK